MPQTKIEWTASQNPDGSWLQGYTWNPWLGCTKVSQACDFCYAEAWARRTGQTELWAGQRRRTTHTYWLQPLKWNKQAQANGVRRKVFPSLCDPFDNQVDQAWRAAMWGVVERTPWLDWLILTKRPQNIRKMLPADWGEGWPNVWLGTTVENQEEADRRIHHLLGVPAVVRFLSCEPLLGAVDLMDIKWPPERPRFPSTDDISDSRSALHLVDGSRIDWVIVGGESGPRRRPMDLAWARSLHDQCAAAGVPFFGKQLDKVGSLPPDLAIREFPEPRALS